MAYEFVAPKTGVLKSAVVIDADGNIAQDGDDAAGTKFFSINGLASSANLAQATTLFDKFIGDIAGGTFDSSTMLKTLTFKVENVGE